MNRKQKKLMNQLAYTDFDEIKLPEALDIDIKRIKQRVNDSLDSVPQERQRHARQKRLKIALTLAAVLVITTTTVWAATKIDVLKLFRTGDMASMEQYVQNSGESVTDGKFILALEQSLAYQNRVAFIYSVEAVTKAAKKELMGDDFNNLITIHLPENSGIRYSMGTYKEQTDLRTNTKRYFSYYMEGLDNPELLPISFSLDVMADSEKRVLIEMDTTVEILELTLSAEGGGDTIVRMSPVDIFVEKDNPAGYEGFMKVSYLDMYFRLADGSLKTFNELYEPQGGSLGSEGWRYKHSAIAREIVDLSVIKSIIVGNLEFDLNDPTHVNEIEIPKAFRPVTVEPLVYHGAYSVPLTEAMNKLGGTVAYDPAGQKAVIEYRGIVLEIQADEEKFLLNDQPVDYEFGWPVTITDDGVWGLNDHVFRDYLRVKSVGDYIAESYDEETGKMPLVQIYLIP